MTAEEFCRAFEATNHMLVVRFLNGHEAIAVGLNGDLVVMHDGEQVPVDQLAIDADGLCLRVASTRASG